MDNDEDLRGTLTAASGLQWLASLKSEKPELLRAVEGVGEDQDLRAWAVAGATAWDMQVAARALLAPGWRLLQILEEAGFGTGPLDDVQVYGSDVFGRYVRMSHAIGCQHHELLRADDDFLSLGEFLPLWIEARAERERNYFSRRWCSKCGGFSIRRLSDAQFEWLATCSAITELRKTLEWYEHQEPALRALTGGASSGAHWEGQAIRLREAEDEASARAEHQTDETLRETLLGLRDWAGVLRRRAEVRRDS